MQLMQVARKALQLGVQRVKGPAPPPPDGEEDEMAKTEREIAELDCCGIA